MMAALARIEAIHQDVIPVELPETAIPVTPESIAQVRQEIARNQAQLDFMQAVASLPNLPIAPEGADVFQMSMFGEPGIAINKQGGKRKK